MNEAALYSRAGSGARSCPNLALNAGIAIAKQVEAAIREKILYLASSPGGSHWRKDLTDEPVEKPFSMAAAM